MKKYFTFGLIMSLVSGACFAEHPMIAQLIREKQQKMEKLEKCKGTTKNLKIAGISTLGITAVGVGANIAEAVVLSNTKEDVKKAKEVRDKEQKIKNERIQREEQDHLFVNLCNSFGGNLLENQTACNVVKRKYADYAELLSKAEQSGGKCQETQVRDKNSATCEYPNKHILSIDLVADKQQNSGQAGNGNQQASDQGNKEQNSAGTKQEQTPAEKTEEIAAKKSDEEFMNACKNMGYRLSDKNSGELSCFYEVKTPTKKADMEPMASNQVRGAIGALCAGNTLRDMNNYYAIYCGKGTLDHRLYITFKNIAEETPEAPAEETPEAPAEETPEAPAEETPEAPAEETPEAPAEETPEAPAEDGNGTKTEGDSL